MAGISGTRIEFFCLLLQAAITWAWQLHFPNLLGTDAYYLVVQAQSVLSTGSLKIPDGDPIPFFMAGIMHLGVSGESAFQMTIAIIHALMIGLLVGFILRQGWRRGAILGCLALVVGESIGLYHVFEFPKLSLALVTLFAAIATYRADAIFRVGSVGLFAVATLIHPAVWPVAVLGLGFLVYSDAGISQYRPALYVASLGVIASSAAYLLLRQGNGILDRFSESGSGPGLVVFMSRDNIPRLLQVGVSSVIVLLFGLLCIALFKRRYAQAVVHGALLSLTLLPASVDETFGLGERMALIVAIAGLPIAMMMVNGVPASKAAKTSSPKSGIIAIATLSLTSILAQSAFGKVLSTADYPRLKVIVDRVETRKPEMLIAPRALSFYYTARTGRDAFMFDPDPDWDRSKIWRVAFNVDVSEILYFAPAYCAEEPGLTETIPRSDAVLIREDCWEAFRKEVSKGELPGLWERVWDSEVNPSKMRPKFLRDRYSTAPI